MTVPATAKRRRKRSGAPTDRLGPGDWLRVARQELIANGILAVKIGRLTRRLGVGRGSFYWHFRGHADLLRRLLADWMATNTAPFEQILEAGLDGRAEFDAVVELWISGTAYDPRYDTAVREWARISKPVARAVRRADQQRIAVLQRIFRDLGFRDPEALIRARITYFHQVGYYTLGIEETRARRLRLGPYYTQVLLGAAAGRRRRKAIPRTPTTTRD